MEPTDVGEELSSSYAIRAVLFDADGVLQQSGAFPDYVRDRLNWSEEDFRGFLAELFAHPLYEGCLEGRTTFLPMLEAILGSRTCPVTPAEFMADWHRIGIAAVPGAFGLVAQLRASGVVCGLATNQDPERAAFMDEDLGYGQCFDHSFYSCRLGVKKPSPDYFRHALGIMDLAPQRCCSSTTIPPTWKQLSRSGSTPRSSRPAAIWWRLFGAMDCWWRWAVPARSRHWRTGQPCQPLRDARSAGVAKR